MFPALSVHVLRPAWSGVLRIAGLSLLVLGSAGRLAAVGDIPLTNWTVPSGRPGTLSTLAGDAGSPGVFVPFSPCRIADTRAGSGFAGSYGAPSIPGGTSRTMNVVASGCSGIAAYATAVSLNVTATNTQGAGFLMVYPAGGATPQVSTLNYLAGQTLANAAIVPLGSGSITIVAGVSGTDVIVDVNGYFTNGTNPQTSLFVSTNRDNGAAITGFNESNADGSHGVGGYAAGLGMVHGVQGQLSEGAGLWSSGVHGVATNRNKNFGVIGDVVGAVLTSALTNFPRGAGVLGRGVEHGVAGFANEPSPTTVSFGTSGCIVDGLGAYKVGGMLGMEWPTGEHYGVYYDGGLGGFGTKSFLEPHPTDPERIVRYYSLEGPESGTYCRGSAATSGGVALLELPDTFRWVTDVEGLTVQVTPTGPEFVQFRVEKKGLEQVVVRTSQDTTFDWVVQGVRRAYKGAEVTPRSQLLKPSGPDSRIPAFLSADEKARVVASGLYDADGSVNLRTAERLGWTREWEARATETRKK